MSSLAIKSAFQALNRSFCRLSSSKFNTTVRMINTESVTISQDHQFQQSQAQQTNSQPQPHHQQQQQQDPITIGQTTVKQLKRVLGDGEFLRVSVDSGGCKGFNYVFKLDNQLQSDDQVFERDNVKVVVDQESLQFLKGSTIEYSQELIRSAFRIQSNPQMKEGCSCGSSFAPKF